MKDKIKRIIAAYKASYVKPLRQDMYPDGQVPYYPEQEQTYTDLKEKESPHGPLTDKERYKFVYPDPTTNPDWADGNFRAPYDNKLLDFNKTPNNNVTLFDPLKGGSMIDDLGNRHSNAIDNFLTMEKKGYVKVSSMDLTNFMKKSDDTLIHKSTKDLWKMFKDADGNIYIKRLFDDNVITE